MRAFGVHCTRERKMSVPDKLVPELPTKILSQKSKADCERRLTGQLLTQPNPNSEIFGELEIFTHVCAVH